MRSILIAIMFLLSGYSVKIGNRYEGKNCELILKSDSSFYYEYHLGWKFFHSEGIWESFNNMVILHESFPNLKDLPFEIVESYKENQKGIVIEIFSKSGRFVDINNTLRFTIRSENGYSRSDSTNILYLPKIFPKGMFKIYLARNDSNLIPFDAVHEISSKSFKIDDKINFIKIVFPFDEKIFNYNHLNCDTLIIKRNRLKCMKNNNEYIFMEK